MIRMLTFLAGLLLGASGASAQTTEVAFGAPREDRDAPVEVTADRLSINEASGRAVYTGDVVVVQGDTRLAAERVVIFFIEAEDRIDRMEAEGGVTLLSGEDAAESRTATYDVESGIVVMVDDVLMVRDTGTMTGDRLDADLDAGTAELTGRVRSVLQPSSGDD